MPSEKSKIISGLCEKYIFEVVMADSSDEDNEEETTEMFLMHMANLLGNRRSVHFGVPKSEKWQQNVLKEFDQMVRVRPEEFFYILDLIKDDEVFKTSSSTAQLPVEMQLKIVLYRLGSYGDGLSIRKVATLFGVGDGGTIQIVTDRVFKAILNLKKRFLFWPNSRERSEILYATKDEMPGCIGYIEGSEIKLAEAPVKNHELFFSRKRQYAIKVQAVCDYKLRIRQLTVGYPGSVHDAKIFLNCPIAKHHERFVSPPQWIAGDSAYPLKSFLLTPFRTNSIEHTKEERVLYNKHFSKYRVRIENCFGILKEKFSSLKELKLRMMSDKNKMLCNDWIIVCGILHNILIDFNAENKSEILIPEINLPPESNTRSGLLQFIQIQNV
ncbi:putative nuclease HARBI1 [Calliphora vicina]|uniref:putative nuclease HARBI1 n=1 Tax=Calliphora vicina TaxID=7373 RepID=UPI00325BECB0